MFSFAGGVFENIDFTMDYKAHKEPAMKFDLGDYYLYTMGGTSGGPVLGLIMNILKGIIGAIGMDLFRQKKY